MRLPWGSIAVLCIIALVFMLVAIFDIPTYDELYRRRLPKEPLTQAEIRQLGALHAMNDFCNYYIEDTPKAENLEMRMGFNPAQNDALDKAKESFRNEDCSRLLFQFPEIYHYVKL